MSNKLLKWLRIIGLAACAGIGAMQLIYALCWAWQNGSNVQDFYDAGIYFRDAVSLSSDGWHLSGYTCILRAFMSFESLLGNGYIVLLYIFQVLCSLLCFAEGCRSICKYLFRHSFSYCQMLLPAAYILTVPIIWQMQFAVLPDALCLSLTVLVMAKLLECVVKSEHLNVYCYFIIFGSILGVGVMNHHYYYGILCLLLINIFVLFFRLFHSKYRIKAKLWHIILLFVISTSVTIIVQYANQKVPVSDDYTPYSIEAELLSRFVYPNIQADYPYYSARVQEVLPAETAQTQIIYHETYYNDIGVLMKNGCDGDVSELFINMANVGFSRHSREIISSTLKEVVLYTFMPFSVVKNMYSNGNSLYGHNYTKMYEMSPEFTSDYMHLAMNGFLVIGVMGIIMLVIRLLTNKKCIKRNIVVLLYMIVCVWSVMFPMMLFSIMKFDYRIGLFSCFIWGILSIICIYTSINDKKLK